MYTEELTSIFTVFHEITLLLQALICHGGNDSDTGFILLQ